MPQINFSINEEENNKVNEYSKLWNLSKPETIKRMIINFTEVNNA